MLLRQRIENQMRLPGAYAANWQSHRPLRRGPILKRQAEDALQPVAACRPVQSFAYRRPQLWLAARTKSFGHLRVGLGPQSGVADVRNSEPCQKCRLVVQDRALTIEMGLSRWGHLIAWMFRCPKSTVYKKHSPTVLCRWSGIARRLHSEMLAT